MGQIVVQSLGKAFRQYPSRWSRLIEWLDPRGKQRHHQHWVLKDIQFQIEAGSAVGLIGINGAGKSTLLKLITGTLQPTLGSARVTGSLSALLELGMGFHPDFTGRQNVYMAGQLMGMTPDEVTQLLPEIEAFAEIGSYIDQPVRIYSSGMQVRLAFSVATARRPDILIVDEALSVGDAHFQHKSFERIRSYRDQGTTLLLVSHDALSVQSLCDRAILLSQGRIVRDGSPEEVMDYYNALLADNSAATVQVTGESEGVAQTSSGNHKATIKSIKFQDANGHSADLLLSGQSACLLIEVEINEPIPELVVGFKIKDRFGNEMYGSNSYYMQQVEFNLPVGKVLIYCYAMSVDLGPGNYSISVALHGGESHLAANYEWRDRAHIFKVVNTDMVPHFVGNTYLKPQLTINK
jgi:lipopolysaccharide transport system ATP-binding protein